MPVLPLGLRRLHTNIECPHCKALLEIGAEAIKDDDPIGTHIVCPLCEETIVIEMEKLPLAWIGEIAWHV
jgi:C4-type Zn-finger protein